jgi:hypothetical protein
MTEQEMNPEVEPEGFPDELSDEALDRAEGAACQKCGRCFSQ